MFYFLTNYFNWLLRQMLNFKNKFRKQRNTLLAIITPPCIYEHKTKHVLYWLVCVIRSSFFVFNQCKNKLTCERSQENILIFVLVHKWMIIESKSLLFVLSIYRQTTNVSLSFEFIYNLQMRFSHYESILETI